MSSAHVELSRDLSLFDITMIGVGAMIGAGIWVLAPISSWYSKSSDCRRQE